MSSANSDRGFTLFETLIATGILVTALAGIAQLFVLTTQLTRAATASGAALAAAQDKIETLTGQTFGYDEGGAAVTAPTLLASPASSLEEDVDPYVDWLDSEAVILHNADASAFVRRWRISSLDGALPDAIAIEVCVYRMPAGGRGPASADACLSTVRTRQP
jgi:type II secretory pathway pseudopilin PulG